MSGFAHRTRVQEKGVFMRGHSGGCSLVGVVAVCAGRIDDRGCRQRQCLVAGRADRASGARRHLAARSDHGVESPIQTREDRAAGSGSTTAIPTFALEMIGSRTFDDRIQLLECLPTILSGPPGADTVRA
jgi:hypothetical protein